MEEKRKKENMESRINQFIIECMFNKYFEEAEIASSLPSVAPRNDEVAHTLQ